MSRLPSRPAASGRVAVLHRAAGEVRALVAEAGAGRPRVVAFSRFGPQDAARVDAWLDDQGAVDVVAVLPSAAAVCRTCALPAADESALAQALALQAEALLPGAAPPHRMASAVLPAAAGEPGRAGLIVAWPEAARVDLPPTRRDVDFAPDVAGVAAVLGAARPAEPLVGLDPATGSVALALSHAGGIVFRAARGDSSSPAAWRESVARIVAETALSAGHAGSFTETLVEALRRQAAGLEPTAAALLLPAELLETARRSIHVDRADPSWWREYGVAAGVALARLGPLAPLTRLRWAAPLESPSLLRQAVERLSNPGTAARIVAACVLVVMLAPLAGAGLRLGLIKLKYRGVESDLDALDETRTRLVIYEDLSEQSWPMAKLLSDIACCTPRSVDIDQVHLRRGEPIRLGGRVRPHEKLSAQEVVAQMQENLAATRIFSGFRITWGKGDNFQSYEFTLSADVARPYFSYGYPIELDYGRWTLADRLYGSPTPPRDEPPAAVTVSQTTERPAGEAHVVETAEENGDGAAPPANSSPSRAVRPRPALPNLTDGGKRFEGDAADHSSNRGAALPPSQKIPEPLTEEQIGAMTLPELTEALTRIAAARQLARLDDETRERLKREFDLVKDRRKVLIDRGSAP